MKKKILALIMASTLVLAMTAMAGCGSSSDADSSDASSTSSTEIEAEMEDDTEVSSVGAVDETDVAEETTDVSEEETPEESSSGEVLTGDTEITDEDMQEVYASIKESIETRYLEPNNILPEEFSWNTIDSSVWSSYYTYAGSHVVNYIVVTKSWETVEDLNESLSNNNNEYPSPDKELLDDVLLGIIDWLDSKGDYEIEYYNNLMEKMLEPSLIDNLSENIIFN